MPESSVREPEELRLDTVIAASLRAIRIRCQLEEFWSISRLQLKQGR